MKTVIFLITLTTLILILGKNLNPFAKQMFTFHDETQPARIQQFALNLQQGKIPPRVAPDFAFEMGYPVFNFYAPTAYWITSFIYLIGADIISALKLSFLFALLLAFLSSFFFLKLFFDFYPSLFGSVIYITSLYFPLTIFVRGNLGELWFLVLLPLAFYFGFKNSIAYDKKILLTTSSVFFLTLTVHNIYSLLFIPTISLFILFLKNRKRNFFSLIFAFLLTSYFWIPALVEMKYTWAKEVATMTLFNDHFLCPYQLWQSQWGFGGSTEGCQNDGMSFKIGKLQIIFGVLGLLWLLANGKKYKNKPFMFYSLFFILLTAGSLFMSTYLSQPIWNILSPILSFIQFPWRFIGLSLMGIAFFSSFFWHSIKITFKNILITVSIIAVLFFNGKYFQGQTMSRENFQKKYLSREYITKQVAYKIAEYLPKTTDYRYWRSLEKRENIPNNFLAYRSIAPFSYKQQTAIERIGNGITLLSFALFIVILKVKWMI